MKGKPLTEKEAGEALKSLGADDTVNGFAICDPDGKFTDGVMTWGVGETEAAAWHDFGYPSLNVDAYKKDGWKCKPMKLRRKKS